MVRPTGPGGFVFQWFAQRAWRGFVFQWSAQRARGDSFFNGSPNAPRGVSFFNGLPNGPGGFRFSMVRPTRPGVSFFNGLPNGPGGIRFSMVRPTRSGLILVRPTCARYWLAQPRVDTGSPNWARFCVFLQAFWVALLHPDCTLIAP